MTPAQRPNDDELSLLVERARAGDSDALDALVRAIQDDIYNLAVRAVAPS